MRQLGFEEAMIAAGLQVPNEWMPLIPAYTRAEGARAMSKLLPSRRPPDAVFCFNDLTACAA